MNRSEATAFACALAVAGIIGAVLLGQYLAPRRSWSEVSAGGAELSPPVEVSLGAPAFTIGGTGRLDLPLGIVPINYCASHPIACAPGERHANAEPPPRLRGTIGTGEED